MNVTATGTPAAPLDTLDEGTVTRVLEALGVARRATYGQHNWLISAPYRQDQRPSCSINRASGLWNDKGTQQSGTLIDLVMLTRGCDHVAALALIEACGGRTRAASPGTSPGRAPITARYAYHDESGQLLYTVSRTADKTFFPTLPDGRYSYGARRVLYRLDELAQAEPDTWVLLCEGERDVDTARAYNLLATTSPGGANAWRAEYADALAGRKVAIVPDHDEPGWRYAQAAAASLNGVVSQVRVIELPDLGERTAKHGRDLSDWFAAGHDEFELLALIEEAPAWTASSDTALAGEASWPKRSLLLGATSEPDARRLSLDLLPPALRGWLLDIAARLCVPVESVAAPAIVALSAVVGRQLTIRPRRLDPHGIVPNLWGMDVAPPSAMKTVRVQQALAPIHTLAQRARGEHRANAPLENMTRATLEAEALAVRQELGRAARAHGTTRLLELQGSLLDLEQKLAATQTFERRYLVQDATVEMLGELLLQNPRGLLLYRDELSGWLRTLERRGREGEREFYLECWNGNGGFTTDRIGRGTRHIPAACLAVYGTIQPAKLKSYVNKALTDDSSADGFLQRFQLMLWTEPIPYQDHDGAPDEAAYIRALRVYERLDQLDPSALGAQHGADDFPYLHFTPAAQARFNAWRTTLEGRLRSAELRAMPAFEAHLGKYRSLVPSLALLFHLVAWADDQPDTLPAEAGVGVTALELAFGWADLLEQHARRIYRAETERELRAAAALAERIEDGYVSDGMRVRDIHYRRWPELRERERVAQALAQLEQLGWLRVELQRPPTGRPSQRVRLHPELRDEPS